MTDGPVEIETPGGGGGATTLDELSDVVITSPTSGQVLKYNGTVWVNGTDAGGGGNITVEEQDVVKVSSATTLDFNGNDFDIVDEGGGEARINLSNDVARTSHSHSAADITSGVLAQARIATGTAAAGTAPVSDGSGGTAWTNIATQTELDAHLNDPVDAHAASAISVAPDGEITGSNLDTVQEVLSELMNRRTGGLSIFTRVRTACELYDDFLGGGTEDGEVGDLGWIVTLTNGGVIGNNISLVQGGWVTVGPGGNTNGAAQIELAPSLILGSSGPLTVEFRAMINTLNDGTHAMAAAFGLVTDADIGATRTHGLEFVYDSTLSPSTTWHARAITSGTATTVNTGVTVAAGTPRRFRIKKQGSTAYFYIDRDDFDPDPDHGLVATINTNVPNGFEAVNIGAAVRKRTGAGGGRQLQIDYMVARIEMAR